MVAVLVVMMAAMLVATSLLSIATSNAAVTSGEVDRVQARALAMSGVEAAMALLQEQRDMILSGNSPELDDEFVIYDEAGRLGVVRFLEHGADGELLVAEGGKLDLNSVSESQLVATGMVDEAMAAAIVEARGQLGEFASIADLLDVPGVTADILWGPMEEIEVIPPPRDIGERIAARLVGDEVRGLSDVVTVWSVSVPIRRDGAARENLNTPRAEKFDEVIELALRAISDAGETFTDENVNASLLSLDVPVMDLVPVIDAMCFNEDEFDYGKLDINSATYEALVAMDAMTADAPAHIVRARKSLDSEMRASPLWLVSEGVLERGDYAKLAGNISTRCWTWRVRVAGGEVAIEDADGPLTSPIVYEAVIDLAGPRARIAYLRDITHLEIAAHWAVEPPPNPPEEAGEPIEDPEGEVIHNSSPGAGAAVPRRRGGRWRPTSTAIP